MNLAKQNTAKSFLVGPILDSAGVAKTDEVVGSVKVAKNGSVGAANASSTLTHNHAGTYVYAANAGDFDTLGEVQFSLDSGANAMAPVAFQVVPAAIYDAWVAGSARLPVDVDTIKTKSVTVDEGGTTFPASIHASGAAVAKSPATLAAADVSGNLPADIKAYTVQPTVAGATLHSDYDAAKTAAAAGAAMTLTAGERSSIGTAVWATTTRTLSSFGTLIADIWSYATRTLSAFAFTPSLHADYDAAKTAAQPGDEMALTGAAITAVQSGLATLANQTTLLNRLTSARAAMIDNLDVGGLVASASGVAAITQAARVRVVAPSQIERPDADSVTYRVWIYAYNSLHQGEDLDDVPAVTAINNAQVDRSANLSAVTRDALGVYYADYTVASDHAIEGLVFKVDATEGGVTTRYAASSLVVDTTAVDYTSADRSRDNAAKAILDLLPDGGALTSLATDADLTTLLGRITEARAGYLDKLNVTGDVAHTDNAAQFKADVADLATSVALASAQSALDLVQAVTDRLGALVEDSAGDRFTEKALEQGPSGTVEGALDWSAEQKATILAQLAKIDTRNVLVRSMLDDDENLTLIEGDDYTAASPNGALSWTRENYTGPDLDGTTGTLRVMTRTNFARGEDAAELEADVAIAQVGTTVTMTCDLAAASLAALNQITPPVSRHAYRYQVAVTLGELTATLKRGWLTLEKGIEAPAA